MFAQRARPLHAVMSASVRTPAANRRRRLRLRLAAAGAAPTAGRSGVRLAVHHRRPGGDQLYDQTMCAIELEQAAEGVADPTLRPGSGLALIVARAQVRTARLRPREPPVLGLRAAGYPRDEIAEVTGHSQRTIDRQPMRARRKRRDALRAGTATGSAPSVSALRESSRGGVRRRACERVQRHGQR